MGGGTVRLRVHRNRPQSERAGGADDAAGDLAAVGDQDGGERPADGLGHLEGPAVTIMRSGVGLKSLHGLFICGQFETRTRMSISARNATRLPGAEMPSTMPSVPSASIGTFMNQLRLDTRSRGPMPYLLASARKFSRQPCSAAVWCPYRRVLD